MEFVQIKRRVCGKSSSFLWCKRYSAMWSNSQKHSKAGLSVSVDAHSTGDQEVTGSTPAGVGNILSRRLLIQEGQLSVSGERMCTILVNRLED